MTDEEILLSQQKLGDIIINPPIVKTFVKDSIPNVIDNTQSPLQLDENAVNKLLDDDFGFLSGIAGTGKSTIINEVSRLYPNLLEVCASTGIAAVNLNSKTLHSTLKFFDYYSLEVAWQEQVLHYNLRLVRSRRQKLLIDEISMIDAGTFDLIMSAVDEINSDGTGKTLGVWLTGDMAQLPPIKNKLYDYKGNGQYIFKSDYWDRFAKNTIRLTKVWRQDNIEFMKGINLIRAGKGVEAIKVFKECGVIFAKEVDNNFIGTTLIPKNNEVDAYNEKRLRMLTTSLIRVDSKSYGKQLREWQKLIPIELRVKVGALVMLLANDIPDFNYVNGDTGIIEDYNAKDEIFKVKLKRTGKLIKISRIARTNLSDKEPDFPSGGFTPYSDYKTGQWVIGRILYFPLRLAYASSIHKSQGLSLDTVQIDARHNFFSYPSMGYVGISRARTPSGLILVGDPESIGRKMRMSSEVKQYV